MREGIKRKIHKEIAAVLTALGEKENELIAIREEEEKNPKDVKEAMDEVIDSPGKEHKASETTISQLTKLAEKKRDIATFQERVSADLPNQTVVTEMEFYSDIQQFCTTQKKQIKYI